MLKKITDAVNTVSDNGWAFLLCGLAVVLVICAMFHKATASSGDHFTAVLAFAGTIVTGAFAMFHGKHPGDKDKENG